MYLEEYARQHGLRNIRHFWDDGYTGTNFNRPGFNALLSEIEAGHVATLIVKDLSRFGRNYLQVGYYTEVVFPKKGVRFIAINNCNRAQLYTGPVQLRSCRRLDETGLAIPFTTPIPSQGKLHFPCAASQLSFCSSRPGTKRTSLHPWTSLDREHNQIRFQTVRQEQFCRTVFLGMSKTPPTNRAVIQYVDVQPKAATQTGPCEARASKHIYG